MSGNICTVCRVETSSREHYRAHKAKEWELLWHLEATEATGPRTLAALLRRRLEFLEDNDAGRLSHDEFLRIADEIQRDALAYLKAQAS